jgi:hypothetical protein
MDVLLIHFYAQEYFVYDNKYINKINARIAKSQESSL